MRFLKKIPLLFLLLFSIFVNANSYKELITILNKNNEVIEFYVEIADEDYEKSKGLMWRTSLGIDEGMLFIWKDSKIRNFWMKNTPLSLDIIFIDQDKKIVRIEENTVPFSENIISSRVSSMYVLEVLGGNSKELNIDVGDTIKLF